MKKAAGKYIYEGGQALMMLVILLLVVALMLFSLVGPDILAMLGISGTQTESKRVAVQAETGLEDMIYRVQNGLSYDNQETLLIDGGSVAVSVLVDSETGDINVVSSGTSESGVVRTKKADLVLSDEATFNNAVSVGDEGLIMEDSASIEGDVEVGGDITGDGNNINGDVTVIGDGNTVTDVDVSGNLVTDIATGVIVEGNSTISNTSISTITLGNTTVGNTTGTTPASVAFAYPLAKESVDRWISLLPSFTASACPYRITTNVVLEELSIPCTLIIEGNAIVSLRGTVRAYKIILRDAARIKVHESLGYRSALMIADNPYDRSLQSNILVEDDVVFEGTDKDSSYVFLVSTNTTDQAIVMKNNARGDVALLAHDGLAALMNDTSAALILAKGAVLSGDAIVQYNTGLKNVFVEVGEGGTWNVRSWKEIE